MVQSTAKPYRLGELLIDRGVITQRQLKRALYYQSASNQSIGESLIALGYVSQNQLTRTLWRQKWLRVIAAIIMVVAPATSVFAAQPASAKNVPTVKRLLNKFTFEQSEVADNQYTLGIQYRFSNRSSLKFGFEHRAGDFLESQWSPEISLAKFGQSLKPKPSYYYAHSQFNRDASNRYKNTMPALYRLTIKGYSLFENSGDQNRYFNFDRQKGDPTRKYQLMFSITKRFN